jgi:multidrug resistance efflux pump
VVEAVELRPGDIVAANAPALSLLDTAHLWVRAYVPEGQLGRIRLGQQIPLRIDGLPDQRFTGRITFIAPEAEFTPRNVQTPEERSKQVFRTKITLESGQERLRVGMMADVLLGEAEKAESERKNPK